MKSKTKTYALLVLVLGVWGIIGYRVFSTINPSTPDVVHQDFGVSFNPKANTEVDTFSIHVFNRDPFLGTLLVKKTPKKRAKKSIKKEMVWLPITYHGNVSKKDTNTKVFVISISGQQYLMKVGQTIKDVKLIKGNSKDIVVTYKGAKKTISKV